MKLDDVTGAMLLVNKMSAIDSIEHIAESERG